MVSAAQHAPVKEETAFPGTGPLLSRPTRPSLLPRALVGILGLVWRLGLLPATVRLSRALVKGTVRVGGGEWVGDGSFWGRVRKGKGRVVRAGAGGFAGGNVLRIFPLCTVACGRRNTLRQTTHTRERDRQRRSQCTDSERARRRGSRVGRSAVLGVLCVTFGALSS